MTRFIKCSIKILILSFFYFFCSCGTKNKDEKKTKKIEISFPVRVGNNWGLSDTLGNFILYPELEYMGSFNSGYAIAVRNKKYFYIDKKGKRVSKESYLGASDFSDGRAFVLDSLNRIVCIDTSFKKCFILPDTIDEAGIFSEGYANVKCKEKYGFVDITGALKIPFKFCVSGDFKEGLAPVALKEKIGGKDSIAYRHFYIDKKGNQVHKSFYNEAYSYSQGLAVVQTDSGYWGWIDKSGKLLFGNKFEECKSFSEGFAPFKINGLWGLINLKGEVTIHPSFISMTEMHEGLLVVGLAPQVYGYVDCAGKMFLRPEFKSASVFKDSFSYAVRDQRISILKRDGGIICIEQFDSAPSFLGLDLGFLEYSINRHLARIDTFNKTIMP